MNLNRTDILALSKLAYHARADWIEVIMTSSHAAVARLLKAGYIERDPDWSGCLHATAAGIDAYNAALNREQNR